MIANANGTAECGPLRGLRLAAGKSQERLARDADCSTSMVRLIERGYRPSDDMLARIAGALSCEPDDLKTSEAVPAQDGSAKTSEAALDHAPR